MTVYIDMKLYYVVTELYSEFKNKSTNVRKVLKYKTYAALHSVAVMFPIMDMANKIIRNFDGKFHKFFISKVSAQ